MVWKPLAHTAACLAGAFLLGGLIGFERQFRHRLAGLRTNTLVAVGAATFVVFSSLVSGDSSPTRVAAQIVSGIGFLGAGIIFKEGFNVRGFNTAATLWCSAAVGVLCGAGLISHAAVATVFIIAVNALLRPLVQVLEFQAMRRGAFQPTYAIDIICHGDAEAQVRALLLRDIGDHLHIHELESSNIEGTNRVEVSATVRADQRQDRLLEQIVGHLSLEPRITSARWRIEDDSGGLSGL
ncbi:protein MgtC [Brucella ovis IntaBari-2006-46-332]|uniref:Protein MgtC n=1 Tax=Brucella ovis (strain ATCC 25840 / 63/290 / NCTC 10512) TaxID=444178 RepID=A0A0H3AU40_BRUO2|nr:MgtC/SapB family protein [Brucella ovis]ABQ62367.1 MgtC family protein [Brucella ovis ATCC 25840]ENR02124.1 protein MgtC [Brucella ovis 80/125]ENR05322.1 protein MgtC [Brucella ovis F8/05B]ENS93929.1 protein MgtC [Brucella ovis 63/96]ENS95525.1 protein MgtC [Brucella ovis 81/8]